MALYKSVYYYYYYCDLSLVHRRTNLLLRLAEVHPGVYTIVPCLHAISANG